MVQEALVALVALVVQEEQAVQVALEALVVLVEQEVLEVST